MNDINKHKIHYSAKFEQKGKFSKISDIPFHGDFTINAPKNQILKWKNKVISSAIKNMRGKCDYIFKVDFNSMTFFEVYFFDRNSGNEISLFTKTKR